MWDLYCEEFMGNEFMHILTHGKSLWVKRLTFKWVDLGTSNQAKPWVCSIWKGSWNFRVSSWKFHLELPLRLDYQLGKSEKSHQPKPQNPIHDISCMHSTVCRHFFMDKIPQNALLSSTRQFFQHVLLEHSQFDVIPSSQQLPTSKVNETRHKPGHVCGKRAKELQ